MKSIPTLLCLLALLALGIQGCKEPDTTYLYEVAEQSEGSSFSLKNTPKTPVEYLSIAHSDLFDRPLNASDLLGLSNIYIAFGDKQIVSDLIFRGFLTRTDVKMPTEAVMRANPAAFVEEMYRKFYLRAPGEYERWYFVNLIKNNPKVTPELVYYAMISAQEYRFY